MFKSYLKSQPAPVQLMIFLVFWFILMMLSIYITQVYVVHTTGISAAAFPDFLEKDMYQYPNLVFIVNALFAVFSFLLPAFIYACLADPQPVKYLGGIAPGKNSQVLWTVILALALVFFLSPMGQWLKALDLGKASKAMDEQREKFINAYLSSGNLWTTIRSILLLAFLPALSEEFFFRGMVMKFAQSILKKWWLSILISSLLFAAFHTTISEFVPIFIAGIILGTVYYLTSSIWMNVLLHFLFNGLGVVLGMYSDPAWEKSLDQPGKLIGIFGVAAVLAAFCLYMIYKARTPLPATWGVVVLPPKKEETWDMDA